MNLFALRASLLIFSWTAHAQFAVTASQYNHERTNANLAESVLHPSNVRASQFGKLFSRSLDQTVYAQPLLVPNVDMPGLGRRNLLIAASMGNTVYAFDADDPSRTQPYWSRNLGSPAPGDRWIGPVSHGILSTPYIDLNNGIVYVVAKVRGTDIGLYLNALDLKTGALRFNSPQRMTFPFAGGETIVHVPGAIQRAGLLSTGGVLYVAAANILPEAHHLSQEGFLQSFDATDLSQRLGSFQVTPKGQKGGIWQAGRGIASDSSGVYVVTAGGAYDGVTNFGSSFLKFSPGALNLLDWFTPANHEQLFHSNLDPSANGITLIPNSELAFGGGKDGVIYLFKRNAMGKLETSGAPLQKFQASSGCGLTSCTQTLGTAFWSRGAEGYLFVWDRGDRLRSYRFTPSQRFETLAAGTGPFTAAMNGGPSLSSRGSDLASGIVWAVTIDANANDTLQPGVLRAFRASNVAEELYNSGQNAPRDALGFFTKFGQPVVANGRVYVATHSNAVQVYGLLCRQQVTNALSAVKGALSFDKASRRYTQTLTITYTGSEPLSGPVDVTVNGLTKRTRVLNASGSTKCAAPAARPYLSLPTPLWLTAGSSLQLTLEFEHNGSLPIDYSVSLLTGSGDR